MYIAFAFGWTSTLELKKESFCASYFEAPLPFVLYLQGNATIGEETLDKLIS